MAGSRRSREASAEYRCVISICREETNHLLPLRGGAELTVWKAHQVIRESRRLYNVLQAEASGQHQKKEIGLGTRSVECLFGISRISRITQKHPQDGFVTPRCLTKSLRLLIRLHSCVSVLCSCLCFCFVFGFVFVLSYILRGYFIATTFLII